MTHVFGFVLFVLGLVVHEAGHAVAMYRRGVEIEEAGLGFPVTGKFKLTFRPKFLPFALTICPVLLGAYVKPSERGQEALEGLSYKDQASCYGAGVIANFVFGGGLLVAAMLAINPSVSGRRGVILLGVVAFTLAVSLLRRPLSWVLPIPGLAVLVGIVYLMIDSLENASGPVDTVKIAVSATTWIEVLVIGAVVSLSLGLFNMMPLELLDGGKTTGAFMAARHWHKLRTVHSVVTGVTFLGFFLFLIVKDIISL